MTENMTRAEVAVRAALLAVEEYRVELDLRAVATDPVFASRTTVRFTCAEPGAASWIDLIADRVHGATLNGVALDVSGYDGARLALPALAAGNELVVEADCAYVTTGEGLHRSTDPADGRVYLYTQFAVAEARRVLACFEQPDLKAAFTWVVTAPAGWEVVSTSPTPEPVAVAEGVARWEFAPTPPLPTYLGVVVAGPFHVVRDTYVGPHGTYPLGVLSRASVAEHLEADEVLAVTRAGLAHFESQFCVPFPFAKYDQVFVPEFNLGAMENPGAVTFNEASFVFRGRVTQAARESRAVVILHEMAHMWFGDLVTMRWWDDTWLNESFAEWAGTHVAVAATRFDEAWTSFTQSRKAWAYLNDQLPSTHPIAADAPDLEAVYLNFDGITYAKGASVLRQLVAYVGYEDFLAGLNRHFAEHAWGSASLADLLAALEAASGRDLQAWAAAWLQEPGVTTLQPRVEVDARGHYRRVVVAQLPATRPEGVSAGLRPHRVAVGAYRWAGQGEQRRLVRSQRIEVDVLGEEAEVPGLVGVAQADLLLVNDDDLTYAKLGLDPTGQATALASVGALADSLPRALVWASLWEQVRDGTLAAQDFVDAAVRGLAREDSARIIETVLRQAHVAVARYVSPGIRAEVAARLCAGSAALAEAAEPGSDAQLALAGGHIAAAVDPVRLARLQALLDGSAQLPGLTVDAELRWSIVTRLAARGILGEDLIDATLAADASTRGRQAAARARAAIPTPAAKAAAWAAALTDRGLPNSVLAATVGGFRDDEAPAGLLDGYRARYAAEVPAAYAACAPSEAASLARGLFPDVHPETLEVADALLVDPDLPAGLRRIVVEGRAEVALALRCQEASATT